MSDFPPPPPAPPPPPNLGPPPGYVPYGQQLQYGPAAMRIGLLTKWLVALVAVSIATQAISILLQLSLHGTAGDFLDGTLTENAFEDKLAPFLAIGALSAIAALAQMVILIIWTFRMARNARTMGRLDQKFAPGATIAVNLLGGCTLGILPFFMWRELWRASDPEALPGDPTWRSRSVSPLVGIHLGLTLSAAVAGIGLGIGSAFTQFGSADDTADLAEQFRDQVGLTVVSGLLTLAASVVFLMFVRQIAERHMRATNEN